MLNINSLVKQGEKDSNKKIKKYYHLKDSIKADSTPAKTKIQPII